MLEQHILIKIGQGNWVEATQLLLKQKKLIEEIYEEKSKNDLDKFRIEFGTAVKEKENKLLEQEALLKEKELQKEKQLSRYYVGFLIGASAFLLVLSILLVVIFRAFKLIKRQTNAITLRVSELTHVLDNVDEGILLLTRDLRLKPNYSAFAKHLLQAEPDKLDLQEFLTRLGMEGDLRSQVTNILRATLGENHVAWSLNADNFPQSCAVGDTHLLLGWTPIVRDDLIEEVLISLRNTDVLRSLEAENERNQSIIMAVRGGIQGFGFMTDFSKKVAYIKLGDGDNKQVLRQLHTWKGELRNMGLSSMQDLVHAWEQSVMDRQLKNAQDLQSLVMEKSLLLIKVYQEIYGSEGESALANPGHLIERALSDARKRLSEAGIGLETQVTLGPVNMNEVELRSLNLIAIHAIANCVDHGFLKNLDKFPVRPQRAHLRVDLSENEARLHIGISDDGIGVNWRGLAAKARELNLSWESEEQLLQLVWEDNVSTLEKSKLSQTSGRGIGMAAVRQAVLDLGGEIHFSPNANSRGTLLIASWPKESENVPAVA
jgi:two-component sensor histidine kinase